MKYCQLIAILFGGWFLMIPRPNLPEGSSFRDWQYIAGPFVSPRECEDKLRDGLSTTEKDIEEMQHDRRGAYSQQDINYMFTVIDRMKKGQCVSRETLNGN